MLPQISDEPGEESSGLSMAMVVPQISKVEFVTYTGFSTFSLMGFRRSYLSRLDERMVIMLP